MTKFPLNIESFAGRGLAVHVTFWGFVHVYIDKKRVYPYKRLFYLMDNAGKKVQLKIERLFLDPIPRFWIGENYIELAFPLRWYEYAWMTLPLPLLYYGGWLGVGLGIAAFFLSSRILRSNIRKTMRFVLSGLCTVAAYGIFVFSIVGLVYVLTWYREFQLRNFLSDLSVEDIHGGIHTKASASGTGDSQSPVDALGYPIATVDKIQIRNLLRQYKFDELNPLLASYEEAFKKDFHNEDFALQAYLAFQVADTLLEPYFENWALRYPQNHQPFLARAGYKYVLGWHYRGGSWASETPTENFVRMGEAFADAERDALKALELKPQALTAYVVLMDIARTNGDWQKAKVLYETGLNVCPYAFQLRQSLMISFMPRWGGNYQLMESFASQADTFVSVSPRLNVLHGYAAYDQGRIARRDKQYDEALVKLTEAIGYGEYWRFYEERSRAYWDKDLYLEALMDANRAFYLRPNQPDVLIAKARVLYSMGDVSQSAALVKAAEDIDPMDETVNSWKEWIADRMITEGYQYYQMQDYPRALEIFNYATGYHPQYAPAYFWRGRAYLYLNRFDAAQQDFKEAIRYDPHDFDSYKNLDWVLMQSRDWDTIIKYWTQLIALEPENAKAYFERSGAAFHKGDRQAALYDARKACDLGLSEACTQFSALSQGQ